MSLSPVSSSTGCSTTLLAVVEIQRKPGALGFGFILLVGFLIYSPVFQAGFFWDDTRLFESQEILRSWKGLLRLWTQPVLLSEYYPLTHTTFWLEYHLWGLHPLGYHLSNLFLHLFNALLLWRVLSELKVQGAWLAAALFAFHPVHVETVAWIAERKNVLSLFFYLTALLAFIRFWNLEGVRSRASRPEWRFYFLALGLFLAALLSKTVTATFPVAALILLWWKGHRWRRKDLFLLAPFFILGLCLAAVTLRVESANALYAEVEFNWSFVERGLIAAKALWFYAGKLFYPHPLMAIYPRWEIRQEEISLYPYLISWFLVLGVLGALRRKMKAPLAGLLFFIVTLSPALGFFNIAFFSSSLVADHWQYHASIGLIALSAAAFKRGFRIPDTVGRAPLHPRFIFTAALLGLLGTLTWQRADLFRTGEVLWRDTLRKNPKALQAHYNLAVVLQGKGDWEGAKAHYLDALRLKLDYIAARNNLAVILTHQEKSEEAVQHLREILKRKPNDASAHTNLGIALAGQERFKEAIHHFSQAIRLDPNSMEARHNLKLVFKKAMNLQDARSR